jgi:hypothetical protein
VGSGNRRVALAALTIMVGSAGYYVEKEASRRDAITRDATESSPAQDDTAAHRDDNVRAGVVAAPPDVQAVAAAQDIHHQHLASLDRALAARDPAQLEIAFTHLLPVLLRERPKNVRELFARQPPGEPRDALREELARQWIVLDAAAASGWMDSLVAEDRIAVSRSAMRALRARSPAQALAFARRYDLGWDDGSLEHVVQIWATEDPQAAANWIDAQPHDAWTEKLRARIEEVRRARVSGV